MNNISLTLEQRWFRQFFIGILICIVNGACFIFGIFSPFMKMGAFRYTQSAVNVVSTIGVILSYCSLPTGIIYDRYGPKITLAVGTALNCLGWIGLYLVFYDLDHPLLSSNVIVMSIFYGISQLSASFFETGSILTNLESFSCYRGRVVLIQKTFMGLGSSVVSQIYLGFFEGRGSGIAPFFLFLGIYSFISGVLGICYVRLPSTETYCLGLNVMDEDTRLNGGGEPKMFKKPFLVGSCILALCVVYITSITLIENFVTLSGGERLTIGFLTITVCLLFMSMIFTTPSFDVNEGGYRFGGIGFSSATDTPIIVADDGETQNSGDSQQPECSSCHGGEGAVCSHSPTTECAPNDDNNNGNNTIGNPVLDDASLLNDLPLWENLRHRDIWLLWYLCFAVWGAMTLISTNSSQIYQAMSPDSFSLTLNTVFVSTYGVASALGRVVVGASYPYIQQRRMQVSLFFIVSPVLSVVALPLFLVVPTSALVVPFFLSGLSTGLSWGCAVLVLASYYAHATRGTHYSWLYTAGMLSPIVFNVALFGPTYDHYSRVQGHTDTHACYGTECIAIPLLVCTAANVVAVPVAVYFWRRTVQRSEAVIEPSPQT